MVVYTHATWHVREGHEQAFEEAWRAMATAYQAVPDTPPLKGTLLRRRDAPARYVSFGPWPDMDTIERMRADAGAGAAMAAVRSHCIDADPAAYDEVGVVSDTDGAPSIAARGNT